MCVTKCLCSIKTLGVHTLVHHIQILPTLDPTLLENLFWIWTLWAAVRKMSPLDRLWNWFYYSTAVLEAGGASVNVVPHCCDQLVKTLSHTRWEEQSLDLVLSVSQCTLWWPWMITSIQSSTTFLRECTLCFSSVLPMGQLITKPMDQGCDIDVLGFFYASVHRRLVRYQYAGSAVLNPGKIVIKISLKLTLYSVLSIKQ